MSLPFPLIYMICETFFFYTWDFKLCSIDMPWSKIKLNFTEMYTKLIFKRAMGIWLKAVYKKKKQYLLWSVDVREGGLVWVGSWIYILGGSWPSIIIYPKQFRLTTSSDPSVDLATIYLVPLRVVNQFVILIASLY